MFRTAKNNIPPKKFGETQESYRKRLEKENGILIKKQGLFGEESNSSFKRRVTQNNLEKERKKQQSFFWRD